MENQTTADSQITSRAVEGKHLEHKHGLDEWSPMMPERSGQSVILGEQQPDEMYRCQRVGCSEVVRLKADHGAGG